MKGKKEISLLSHLFISYSYISKGRRKRCTENHAFVWTCAGYCVCTRVQLCNNLSPFALSETRQADFQNRKICQRKMSRIDLIEDRWSMCNFWPGVSNHIRYDNWITWCIECGENAMACALGLSALFLLNCSLCTLRLLPCHPQFASIAWQCHKIPSSLFIGLLSLMNLALLWAQLLELHCIVSSTREAEKPFHCWLSRLLIPCTDGSA